MTQLTTSSKSSRALLFVSGEDIIGTSAIPLGVTELLWMSVRIDCPEGGWNPPVMN